MANKRTKPSATDVIAGLEIGAALSRESTRKEESSAANAIKPSLGSPRTPMAKEIEKAGQGLPARAERAEAKLRELRETGREIFEVDPARIREPEDAYNREESAYHDESFRELRASIANHGQDDPITVVPVEGDKDHDFEVTKGYRRRRACLEIGRKVKCVRSSHAGDPIERELENWRENNDREGLSPIEIARKLQYWIDDKLFKTSGEIAAAIGKSEAWVSQYLGLNRLPPDLVETLSDPRAIPLRDGRALATLIAKDNAALKRAIKAAKHQDTLALPDRGKIKIWIAAAQAKPQTKSSVIQAADGTVLAKRLDGDKGARLAVEHEDSKFIDFLGEKLPELFAEWQSKD